MAMKGPSSDEDGDGAIFAEINITPLTDIFLVLLIIFMVCSTVMARQDAARAGMKVNLPKGAAQEVAPGSSDVTVAVTTTGDIVVDGKVVSPDQLKAIF